MPSSGIFELTAVTSGHAPDVLAIVDTTDTSQSPQGSTRKITLTNFFGTVPAPVVVSAGTVTVSTPVFSATETWNAGGVTFTGMKLNVTDTASAAASLLMDLQVGGVSQWSVTKAGAITNASTLNGQTISSAASFTGTMTVATSITVTTGNMTASAGDVVITAGKLSIGTAVSRIVPGATSLSLRNNANSADNLILTDAGVATIRAGLTVTTGGFTVSAGGANVSGSYTQTTGNFVFGGTSQNIVGSATSLLIRDNGNANTNIGIADGGAITFRGALSGITTISTSSTINSQTISASASFTGTVTVATGLTVSAGGVTITAGDLTGPASFNIKAASAIEFYANGVNSLELSSTKLQELAAIDIVFAVAATRLATNATTGFVFLPTCAGTPTGVPTQASTGRVAMIYDDTNNKLYAYNGAWKASSAFT